MTRLVWPTSILKKTYLEGLAELQESGIALNYSLEQAQEDFDGFLQGLADYADLRKIPVGHVPCLRLWLMDDDVFVGNVTIRLWLNEGVKDKGHVGYEIVPSYRRKGYGKEALRLALALIEEHGMGMDPVQVSCKLANEASRKIIEGQGGVLLRSVRLTDDTDRFPYMLVYAVPRKGSNALIQSISKDDGF